MLPPKLMFQAHKDLSETEKNIIELDCGYPSTPRESIRVVSPCRHWDPCFNWNAAVWEWGCFNQVPLGTPANREAANLWPISATDTVIFDEMIG